MIRNLCLSPEFEEQFYRFDKQVVNGICMDSTSIKTHEKPHEHVDTTNETKIKSRLRVPTSRVERDDDERKSRLIEFASARSNQLIHTLSSLTHSFAYSDSETRRIYTGISNTHVCFGNSFTAFKRSTAASHHSLQFERQTHAFLSAPSGLVSCALALSLLLSFSRALCQYYFRDSCALFVHPIDCLPSGWWILNWAIVSMIFLFISFCFFASSWKFILLPFCVCVTSLLWLFSLLVNSRYFAQFSPNSMKKCQNFWIRSSCCHCNTFDFLPFASNLETNSTRHSAESEMENVWNCLFLSFACPPVRLATARGFSHNRTIYFQFDFVSFPFIHLPKCRHALQSKGKQKKNVNRRHTTMHQMLLFLLRQTQQKPIPTLTHAYTHSLELSVSLVLYVRIDLIRFSFLRFDICRSQSSYFFKKKNHPFDFNFYFSKIFSFELCVHFHTL